MNSKFEMFSILVFGIVMLLIPASSLANAQEYEDKEYKKIDKKSYNEQYKKKDERKAYYNDDKEKSEEPLIIIKNEPIVKKEKKKEMKEPPMLLVKKDVLYCDFVVGEETSPCSSDNGIAGPDSGKYVQQCNDNDFVCENINESSFDMIVTDNIEFPGSEKGKKINFNGERYTVSEEPNIGIVGQDEGLDNQCQEAGFDSGFIVEGDFPLLIFCTVFDGECSGIVQDGELKECTVKNYLIEEEVF